MFSFPGKISSIPSWTELIEIARWCPTVHNLQPHLIKIISESEVELYYNPARLLPLGDPDSIFCTVAMGVFTEHLSIAAAPYGMEVKISEVYDPITTHATAQTLFAKLKMSISVEKEIIDRDLIMQRRTSRSDYDGTPLKNNILDKIKSEAEKFGHEFFYSTDLKIINEIIEFNQHTLFEDLESKPNREELDHLFRYNKEEAETNKDGLWSRCMGFSGPLMKSVFRHHKKWGKGIRKKLLANHYKNSFKNTPMICWFGGKFENTNDWLNAGRMFARNWLLITGEKHTSSHSDHL